MQQLIITYIIINLYLFLYFNNIHLILNLYLNICIQKATHLHFLSYLLIPNNLVKKTSPPESLDHYSYSPIYLILIALSANSKLKSSNP